MPERRRARYAAVVLACAALASPALAADDALLAAIRANDVAAAQAALALPVDPNRRLAFGATALAQAVYSQNPAMTALVLARGAAPDTADSDGLTPLALACELGEPGIIAQLLDARANAKAAAPDGTTPLQVCARFGPAAAVARLLAMDAGVDTTDSRGQTPLMWAAASGRVEAMALLLRAGAGANTVSRAGFTPLFFAIKSGVPAATDALLGAGADPEYRGPEHTSAAQLAAYQHAWGAAALLVARGADVAERDRTGQQLLHAAAAGGDAALVGALLARHADPNGLTGASRITWVTEANFGQPPPPVPPTPPLLIAAANGHAAVMSLLLAAGADAAFVAADGTTIVLAAARGGSAAALDLALRQAPDVNVADAKGHTALHLLVMGGVHPDLGAMLAILAASGARTNIADKRGTTAAAMADGGLNEVKAIFREHFPASPQQTIAVAAPDKRP